MKIRNGFVANSSSSSFCILGIHIDGEDIPESYREIKQREEEIEGDLGEVLDELLKGSDLVWTQEDPYSSDYYVGVDVEDLNKDISIKENEKIIRKKISESLGAPEEDLKIEFLKGVFVNE
jgi:hypothetical protein